MLGHRIVIAGGGIGALEGALALHSLGGPDLRIALVSPHAHFSYRAHQVVEPFGGRPGLMLPLDEILAETDVVHRNAGVVAVDAAERVVTTSAGERLGYDGLLVAVGGTPFPAYAHGVTFDRPGDPAAFEELLSDVIRGLAEEVAFVVPDRAGWSLPAYDLALILRAWAKHHHLPTRIRLVTPERTPLEMFGERASAVVADVLERASIDFSGGGDPVVVSDTAVLAGGHWLNADRIVSLPRLAGPRIPGLPCDWSGFITVGPQGAVPGCPGVYAVGDGAAHPRKQGGLAAQQAGEAARALLAEAGMQPPPPLEDVTLRGVLATPDGPLFLQARPAPAGLEESTASLLPLWDPPAKVYTRWLGPHLDGLVSRRTSAFSAATVK